MGVGFVVLMVIVRNGHKRKEKQVIGDDLCLLFLTCPSFLLGQLGTFALINLLILRWGTLFIKMKSYYLKFQKGF